MADQPTAWALADVDLTRHGVHRVVHPPTYWLDALRAELRHAEAEDAIEHPIRSLKLSGTDDDESSSVRITLEKGSWIELSQEEPVSVQLRTWDDDSPIVAEATVISDAPKHVRIEMSRDDNRVRELIEAHPKQDPKHVFQEVRLSTLRAKALLELMTEFKDVANHRHGIYIALHDANFSKAIQNPPPVPEHVERETRTEQLDAIKLACAHQSMLLWGPPGTGKTYTLSRIAATLAESHKRVLLVSNTNAATDTLLAATRDAVDRRLRPRCRRHGRLPDGAKIMLKDEDIRSSSIIATTAARAIRESDRLHDFDAVLIDEASMLMVPAIAVIASRCHAKGQFVAAGDFCQLPAVIKTHDENAQAILERDVFDTSGVVDTLQAHAARTAESPDPGETPPAPILPTHCAALRVQQRMNTPIMDIANEFGYVWHPLVQGKHAEETPELAPLLGNQVLVGIDISTVLAQSAYHNGSKFNAVSALISRAVAKACAQSGTPVVVTSPYRSQAKLISTMLRDTLGQLQVSPELHPLGTTIHKMQGGECPNVVIDLTDAIGTPLGRFLKGFSPRDVGSRLLNVAVTRARERLVIIAHKGWLRKAAPGLGPVNKLMRRLDRENAWINAEDVLAHGLDANVRKLPPANHTDHPVQNGGVIPVDHTTTHIQVGVDEDRYEVKSLLVAAQLNAMSANRRPFPPRRRASYRSRASIPA